MHHEPSLIVTIAASFGLALVLGFVAARIRLPVLVGYMVAGIILGPASPGFVADVALSQQLAEIGVILLMFGVGLHFSLEDLFAVRRIALPGALLEMTCVTALGAGVASLWGWSVGGCLVFGLCLSVASTVVLVRALERAGLLESVTGHIAIGWLVVEDLVMVLVLVLLPPLAGALGEGYSACQRAVPAGDGAVHTGQGSWFYCVDDGGRQAFVPMAVVAGGAYRLTGIVHIVCDCCRHRYRLRIVCVVWRVAGAGCFFCRHCDARVEPQLSRRTRILAAT
jgi:CPA2 family monovalent cation:H+ antiporter-2